MNKLQNKDDKYLKDIYSEIYKDINTKNKY